MRIAITGGAGFRGSTLSLSPLTAGYEVVVVGDFSSRLRDKLVKGTTLVEASILDADPLHEAFSGADSVVHFAALGSVPRSIADPRASHTANATDRGKTLQINGDGYHSRDFTDVGTVCRVILDAVKRGASHSEPVNVAFGTTTTLLELLARMDAASGPTASVEHRGSRLGDVRHSQADNRVLRSLFPDVEPVPHDEGLSDTCAWSKAIA